MELKVFKRPDTKSGTTKKLRAEGKIPAVIYHSGKFNENIYFNLEDFETILRKIEKGKLSTTILTLLDNKKKYKTIIKDIHYHLTTYNIIHIDFEVLQDSNPVSINVPITCVGIADCVGIKLGGEL